MSYKVETTEEFSADIKTLLEKVLDIVIANTDILIENVDLIQVDPEEFGFEFHPDYSETVVVVNVFAEGSVVAILINEDYELVDYEVIGYDGDDSSVGNPYGEEA